jgi:DNA adenine methylase
MTIPANIDTVTVNEKARLAKPPLKWAGGKRWLVPDLLSLWNSFSDRRFVEPFCGGLAAALGLMPECALLNDINPHLINFIVI